MKYLFIVNPKAGDGTAENVIRTYTACSPERMNCHVHVTKYAGEAIRYVRDYCRQNPDEEIRVIACGGDGTLNEVFNGAAGAAGVSVACYPCGSGNDFVKAFGGAEKFMDIGAVMHAPAKKIDLLKAGNRYADNVINFGFDTTVAITINEERAKTGKGNKNAYTKGVIRALITSMKNSFQVIADGEPLVPGGKALLCTLANGQYVGGSFRCAPRAKTDDGLIDICVIKPISRLRFVRILDTYTKGMHLDDEKMKDIVIYRQAKKVEVIAGKGFAYSLDGEIIRESHFTVEIAPGIIDFAVPE